jgi:hypothetical protein
MARHTINRRSSLRRICLVGAGVLGTLVFSVSMASAAKTHKAPKVKPTKVSCKLAMAVAIPDGDTTLALPAESGNMLGSASCGNLLGSGVENAAFALQDTGDLTGKIKLYFGTGTIKGTFDLSPGDSQMPTPGSFQTQDYTGTAVVAGGTGAYKGVTGTATLVCTSSDSVHLACTEKLKLKRAKA